ncbi:MAG: metallophosphoesterase [Nitrospinota bacterium]|nr:metallophosphoesterase [Nitrospinota bacterium]
MNDSPEFINRPLSRRLFLKVGFGIFGVSVLGVGKGYTNTLSSQIVVERVPIKLKGLPDAFRGFKIAQLSDLHSSPLVDKEHFEHAVDLALAEKPDLIVLTGDYIGHTLRTPSNYIHEFDPQYLDNLVAALGRAKAPFGTYAVLGNHDFWSGPKVTQRICHDFMAHAGVRVLRNQHVTLTKEEESIQLLGVDDYWHSWDLRKTLRKISKNSVKILLSHNPDINWKIKPSHKIDLVLSGHTHGGQVAFPFVGAPFSPTRNHRYLKGLVRDGDRQTYITRGVGHLVVPIRFNCPPEVTLITLV